MMTISVATQSQYSPVRPNWLRTKGKSVRTAITVPAISQDLRVDS